MISVLKPVSNHKYITHDITPLPVPVPDIANGLQTVFSLRVYEDTKSFST